MISSIFKKLKSKIINIWRYPLKKRMTKKCKSCNKRILASNCIGGLLYHDIGKPFTSPTINLTIGGEDFIKLCKKPEFYLKSEPIFEKTSPEGYPIANLNGILIYGVHYPDFETFKEQWVKRSKRFLEHDEQEILVVTTDSFLTTNELLNEFRTLPYRKVCFTNKKESQSEEFPYIPGYDNEIGVGEITKFADRKGTRIFEKYFDCIKWLKNE